MSRDTYQEFCGLSDKKAAGKSLSLAEEARLLELGTTDVVCQKDRDIFRRLTELDVEVSSTRDETILSRALSTVAHEEKVVPLRRQGDVRQASQNQASQNQPKHQGTESSARGRRRMRSALVGVVAAAVLALAFVRLEGTNDAASPPQKMVTQGARSVETVELTFTSGEVLVDGKREVVGPDALGPESVIEVREGGACFSIEKATDVCLAAHSKLRLDALRAGKREVTLLAGRAVAALLPRAPERAFSIVSEGTRATAIGTMYAVERLSSAKTQVTVLEGIVEVQGSSQAKRIAKDQNVLVSGGEVAAPSPTTRSELAKHEATVAPRALWQAKSVGVLHVASEPEGAQVFLSGVAVGSAPVSILLGIGVHEISLESEGYESAKSAPRLTPGEVQRMVVPLKRTPAPELAQKDAHVGAMNPGSPVTGNPVNDQPATILARLSRAREAMKAGKWQEAASIYESLRHAYPGSAESHTVLVTLGQLQLDRLKQPSQALRSFRAYLSVGGPLSQEAQFGKIRALRQLGQGAEEREAISEYLSKFSGSADATNLRVRLSELSKK